MQVQSPTPKRKTEHSPAMVSVYYDQRYIGYVLTRGREEFEAYDHNKQTLGVFKTEDEAATAIWKAAR
jgi:hypothetical protein